ncbi:alpha/beta fold hydrolase [Nocardioides sp. Kera G14]|uniref:alpha/beta fold hydrolase n=1 Tax=Nocardioides sp. Kera G14 TaxID=2884264 RepID=UPI001D0FD543|nr:alpha/beta fold hydrolase [Nocardioides sp. Kera G14]UDY23231.1 alpha/beta hydrolase [Nocardioides sp. Kera G14]
MLTTLSTGAQVFIEDTGAPTPEAETIVFGHGLLFSGRMFKAQVAALRDRYRCVTIDWRGQGRSGPAPDGRYDMDALTEDAVALIDSLDAGPVHYAGLSMGGFVGIRLAARHPERLASLTLLDTSADPEEPGNVREYQLLAAVYRLVGMRPLMKPVAKIMFGSTSLAGPRAGEIVSSLVEAMTGVDRAAMKQAILGVCHRPAVADLLAQIATPTLVIVGAEDAATVPAKAAAIASGIPGAQHEVVPAAGHSSTVEQPEAVTALMTRFLDRVAR